MKCVNCGAEVSGSICEYCGTRYEKGGLLAKFEVGQRNGKLCIGDKEFNVYLSEVEVEASCGTCFGRDIDGRFHYYPDRTLHKFTLQEL